LKKQILISGASGFIGSALMSKLPPDEFDVYVLVRDGSLCEHSRYTRIQIGALSSSDCEFDAVVHLASFITPEKTQQSLSRLLDSNIAFGSRLLSSIKLKPGGLFIDTGTFAELHKNQNGGNQNYLYTATKKAFAEILNFYAEAKKINFCRVLPYTVVCHQRQENKILDILLNSINSSKPIALTPGSQVLDFVHRSDVVDLYMSLLRLEQNVLVHSSSIPCCTGRGTSIRQLADMIELESEAALNVNWGGKKYRDMDILHAVGDPSMSMSLLNWKAKTSIEEVVSMSVAAHSRCSNGTRVTRNKTN
jgi:nucleoside-diphosphate-sugar epimerase